jgi:hypothetical protein
MRTKIASFWGNAFTAERSDDGELCIYHVGSDPIPTSVTGDRRGASPPRMTAAKLQAINERSRTDQKARNAELAPR